MSDMDIDKNRRGLPASLFRLIFGLFLYAVILPQVDARIGHAKRCHRSVEILPGAWPEVVLIDQHGLILSDAPAASRVSEEASEQPPPSGAFGYLEFRIPVS